MEVIHIVGTRPHFIKLKPVFSELHNLGINQCIFHTGQHYDYEMSRIFFEELQIPEPDYYLGVGSGTHGYQTGEMIKRIEDLLLSKRPKLVIVYGDTNSTLAGAIAAVKSGISVGHVEAGPRYPSHYSTKNIEALEPEQINRQLVDHVSTFLFAPTKNSVRNLKREGISDSRIFHTGDTMLDTYQKATKYVKHKFSEIQEYLNIEQHEYILVTLHRPKNVDNPNALKEILNALNSAPLRVVFPVHPRTRKTINNLNTSFSNILFIKPVGYLTFISLIKHARLVVTDSGGVQKEAFFSKVPCLTLKPESEWVELIEAGANRLVGWTPPKEKLLDSIDTVLTSTQRIKWNLKIFGNGKAGKTIASILRRELE